MRLIGVGNRWRGDDAAGLVVAAAVAARRPAGVEVVEHHGEPIELIEACEGAQTVWIVDAVCSGGAAGTVHRLDASVEPLPADLFGVSTHRLGPAEALELARALGRLPAQVIVYGIEAKEFEPGHPLSAPVALAAARLADVLVDELALVSKAG
ncbi:MAG: hydrogenase maturation protease [Solirubrobacteraceae bacterium]